MTTKVKTFGPTANTAATKTQIGSDYNIPDKFGRISGIIVSYYTAALEDASGYIILELDGVKGPFEIPLASVIGATSGLAATPIIIPLNIPGVGGNVLTVSATIVAALTSVHVGVMFD